jgi:hypothetical protein
MLLFFLIQDKVELSFYGFGFFLIRTYVIKIIKLISY